MIQSEVKTTFRAWLNTTANQIMVNAHPQPTTEVHHLIYYLFRFTNDMSGETLYVYPEQDIRKRYSAFEFQYSATPNMYQAQLKLELAGYWKYSVYEVYFEEPPTPDMNANNTPSTELDVLPVALDHGVVKGLVAIGKMYAAESQTKEEVQYKEYVQPASTNYIYTN